MLNARHPPGSVSVLPESLLLREPRNAFMAGAGLETSLESALSVTAPRCSSSEEGLDLSSSTSPRSSTGSGHGTPLQSNLIGDVVAPETVQWVQPSGPRQQGQGTEELEQGIVSAEPSPTGGMHLRITLLAAGFVIGPSGASIRDVCRATGAEVWSWTSPGDARCRRPTRTFRVEGPPASVRAACAVASEAVERYKDLCEGRFAGQSVPRIHRIRGVDFAYQPPPRGQVPHAAMLKGPAGRRGRDRRAHASACENPSTPGHRAGRPLPRAARAPTPGAAAPADRPPPVLRLAPALVAGERAGHGSGVAPAPDTAALLEALGQRTSASLGCGLGPGGLRAVGLDLQLPHQQHQTLVLAQQLLALQALAAADPGFPTQSAAASLLRGHGGPALAPNSLGALDPLLWNLDPAGSACHGALPARMDTSGLLAMQLEPQGPHPTPLHMLPYNWQVQDPLGQLM
ncbi:hypothetical protein ACKKBG_A06450 [Auxenochlorella protothecoides x Auxenochlorella symbiontica]